MSKNIVKALFNPTVLKTAVKAGAGGAVGGLAYDFAAANLGKLHSSLAIDAAWKEAALAAGLGVVGASAMTYFGQSDMAKGHVGAMGAVLARKVLAMAGVSLGFADYLGGGEAVETDPSYLHGLGETAVESSRMSTQLGASTDTYETQGVSAFLGA